jgi:hypothetical protein
MSLESSSNHGIASIAKYYMNTLTSINCKVQEYHMNILMKLDQIHNTIENYVKEGVDLQSLSSSLHITQQVGQLRHMRNRKQQLCWLCGYLGLGSSQTKHCATWRNISTHSLATLACMAPRRIRWATAVLYLLPTLQNSLRHKNEVSGKK